MKKVVFIYNPFSGENRILSHLDYILHQYQDYGYRVIPFRFTEGSGLEKAFADVDDSYHHVLVAGGDGTINSVVNEMQKQGIKLPLAILPAGTAYQTDVGMVGPVDSVIGMKVEASINRFLTQRRVKFQQSEDDAFLFQAVLLEIDGDGRAQHIERIDKRMTIERTRI